VPCCCRRNSGRRGFSGNCPAEKRTGRPPLWNRSTYAAAGRFWAAMVVKLVFAVCWLFARGAAFLGQPGGCPPLGFYPPRQPCGRNWQQFRRSVPPFVLPAATLGVCSTHLRHARASTCAPLRFRLRRKRPAAAASVKRVGSAPPCPMPVAGAQRSPHTVASLTRRC